MTATNTAPTLAIFDLDFTILEGDCEFLFAQFLYHQNLVSRDYLDGIEYYYRQYEAGRLDYAAYEEFFLRPLTQIPFETVLSLREKYLAEIEPLLRTRMLDEVRNHRDSGHDLLMITASNQFVSGPIARMIGIPHIICTLPEIKNGRLTGCLANLPPFRENKVRHLRDWLQANGVSPEDVWFYSDSHNDLPLLQLAEHPVAVTPDAILKEHAKKNQWNIIW